MPFKKGQIANPNGRPKGIPNKHTTAVIERILTVYDQLQKSPKTRLSKIAKDDPQWFYEKIIKMALPKNLEVLHDVGDRTMEYVVDYLGKSAKKKPTRKKRGSRSG